ncbi:MAG: LPS-assembly protein LptD [Alphaproteobacteria bacterium]|nr:LPS-assembly protein LptD [Alphaproteobacteria bacterium]
MIKSVLWFISLFTLPFLLSNQTLAAEKVSLGEIPITVEAHDFSGTAKATEKPLALSSKDPVNMEADRFEYDENGQTISAIGNVEFQQNDSILKADKVSYNLENNVLIAEGNVVLMPPDGRVIFADSMEVQDNLKEGFSRNIRMVLADQSRMSAKEFIYKEKDVSVLKDINYSPCDACKGKPLWSINAESMERDEPEQTIRYYNAWLDFKGVPVIYSPYLSHPDPEVKRKSGLLMPSFGGGKDLGLKFITPYFYVIDDYQDFTFLPTFTTKEGILFGGKYRGRFEKGMLDFEGAITTMDSKRDVRGYFFSDFRYDINRWWRLSTDINYASDDTFLRRYGIGNYNVPWLENTAKIEGFGKNSYFGLSGSFFEEMRYDVDNDFSPLLVPVMQYSYQGNPSSGKGYWSFDAYASASTRKHGTSVQKINTETGWHLPYIGSLGDVYSLAATVRADGYLVQDYFIEEEQKDFSGSTGRILPQLSLEWRYPLVRAEKNSYQVLEPIISGVLAPEGGNPNEIPNEDSRDFEFDYTNLFDPNRFVGHDRIESGSRVNYGMRWGIYSNNVGSASAFIGQSYRFSDDGEFSADSGLGKHSSDYVGRVGINSPQRGFGFNYNFRLDKKSLTPVRSELDFSLAYSFVRLSGYYLDIEEISTEFSQIPKRQEIGLNLHTKLNKYWSAQIYETYDLTKDGGPIEIGGILSYEDECFGLSTQIKREYTEDRDYSGGLSIMFSLTLKTLGTVNTSSSRL